jgi:hypothetical protein
VLRAGARAADCPRPIWSAMRLLTNNAAHRNIRLFPSQHICLGVTPKATAPTFSFFTSTFRLINSWEKGAGFQSIQRGKILDFTVFGSNVSWHSSRTMSSLL